MGYFHSGLSVSAKLMLWNVEVDSQRKIIYHFLLQVKILLLFLLQNLTSNDLFQGCAQAEPGGPWRLTFTLGQLENLRFFIQINAGHPRFYSFRALGSVQFSLEHSLVFTLLRWEHYVQGHDASSQYHWVLFASYEWGFLDFSTPHAFKTTVLAK